MDHKETLVDKELCLVVVLPGGEERTTSVHGSKPLMDLLVTLCAKYRLNPSGHTLELVTANNKSTKLKPNALIGTLEAEKIILKAKGEEKNKKSGPPMPEATVRMVINYKKTQKTILRVNPRVPLAQHLTAICEKCEFDAESTVLLKDVHSLAPLDLSCSLNDYAIREVYARDTGRPPSTPVSPVSPSRAGNVVPGKDKTQKEEENKGLFSKFRKSKKKSEQATTASAPASPVLVSRPRPLSMALPSSGSSALGPATFTDGPKKRRAPLPPVLVSQSRSAELGPRRRINSEPSTHLDGEQLTSVSQGSSAESSLKRTKRKAPPPPTTLCAALQQVIPVDEESPEAKTLEEITEQEETTASAKAATTSDEQPQHGVEASAEAPPPSPGSEVAAAAPAAAAAAAAAAAVVPETNGERHSHDPSPDGEYETPLGPAEPDACVFSLPAACSASSPLCLTPLLLHSQTQSPAAGSAAGSDVGAVGDTSEHADMNGGPSLPEAESPGPPPDGSASERDVERRCSVQTESEAIPQVPDVLHAENAEVQTDDLPPPPSPPPPSPPPPSPPPSSPPPPSPPPPGPSGEAAPTAIAAEKKDMATSTEELASPDLPSVPPQTPETSTGREPGRPAPAAAPTPHAAAAEPRPKPSNELTRDYIPKVGMTTYTVVPQKSLEKLRYFEVALTLERPAGGDGPEGAGPAALTPPPSGNGTVPREQAASSEGKGDESRAAPGEGAAAASAAAAAAAAAAPPTQRTTNGNGSSPVQVKAAKIPPATKPKPGSFRSAQHRTPPGYYVTSAAGKPLQRGVGPEELPLPPPPPPPPLAEAEAGPAGAPWFPRQGGLPSRTPGPALSLEKLRSFATPRPFTPSSPSRFAQAVSSAVRRSQSLSHTPKSGPRAPPSPAADAQGSAELKDAETDSAESSASTGKSDGTERLSGGALIEGQSGP